MNTNSSIIDSISFCVSKNYKGCYEHLLLKAIAELSNVEDFKDTHFVDLENDADGHLLQDCYGVDIALDILHKDPMAKVVMYSFLTIEEVKEKKPQIDIALKFENARWLHCPYHPEELSAIFQNKNQVPATYTMNDEVRKQIGVIMHTFSHIKNWEDPNNYERSEIRKGLSEAREYFPSLRNASDEEVMAFMKKVNAQRPEPMKGLKINGVYCDVEGTILVNCLLNEKVIAKLREYEQAGNTITLWTDGDLELVSEMLFAANAPYASTLKSKYDFGGAIVDIVIDDMDEFTFTGTTKISAVKFINVASL